MMVAQNEKGEVASESFKGIGGQNQIKFFLVLPHDCELIWTKQPLYERGWIHRSPPFAPILCSGRIFIFNEFF